MVVVKLKAGITECKLTSNKILYVSKHDGAYDLTMQRPTARGRGTIYSVLCADKRRLSTINKYAAEFGVRFEEAANED